MPSRKGGPPPAQSGPRRAPQTRAMRRFLLLFSAVAVALFAIYQWSEATSRFRVVNAANATLCAAALRACGIDAAATDTHVRLGSARMDIVSECSAIYVLILFAAAVWAFPTTVRARLLGLAVGIPVLLAVNVVRLVMLGFVLQYRPSLLGFFHEYLWQILFVLVVAVLYLVWIERMVPRARVGQAA